MTRSRGASHPVRLVMLGLLGLLLGGPTLRAQTTQGLITGRVVDSVRGTPVARADIVYESLATHTRGTSRSGPLGFYTVPLLPPGAYRVRVSADDYQSQELQELELKVAAFLEINFQLRPLNDVWEQGQYRSVFLQGSRAILTFFGPDVDTTHSSWLETNPATGGQMESTVSEVIDPAQIEQLPLAGRDVYTMLVTQPGVAADSATSRGLGLAVNGQRPSASNFLLDGIENNNYVSTGPLFPLPPEAIQEYRISTNNFSAEYGKSAGFIANGVSSSGGSQWHGLGYTYWKNSALNANDFQRNLQAFPRSPLHESEAGLSAGGPLKKGSLFASGSLDYFRSRNRGEPQRFTFPTPVFINSLFPGTPARDLLNKYPPPVSGPGLTVDADLEPTVSLDRYSSITRLDYITPGGAHHLLGRVLVNHLSRPDFQWYPYQDFNVPLAQKTIGITLSAVSSLAPELVNEARVGWTQDELTWNRQHPEVPSLVVNGVALPSNGTFYDYRNRMRNWEVTDNVSWSHRQHTIKAGAGLLLRSIDGALTAGSIPQFFYTSLNTFAQGVPFSMTTYVSQGALPAFVAPNYDRSYRNPQWFWFAEDSYRWKPGVVFNLGIRYENFGAPVNVGDTKDTLVELGPGNSLDQALAGAKLVAPAGGDQNLYDADHNNFAARFGFSYNLPGHLKTLLRGAYGVFYDRPFDNLWQNMRSNDLVRGFFSRPAGSIDFSQPASVLIPQFQSASTNRDVITPVLYQPDLRDAYAQNWFFGLEHRLNDAVTIDANLLGSVGRKLITSDRINRPLSVPFNVQNPLGRFNPNLPDIAYRGTQGSSNYNGLGVSLTYQGRPSQLHVAYTWSHAIDNQSDPLIGDFLNLSSAVANTGASQRAAFARQFDSSADRGNADFDQRHSLVIYSLWQLPAAFSSTRLAPLLRDWQFSEMAAFRSGFPFSVSAPSDTGLIVNNRADIIDPGQTTSGQMDIAGGRQLLNPAAFAVPPSRTLGNSGRNAFRAPGFFNVDVSLSRSFAVPRMPEGTFVTLRADVFNLLNHANLGSPDASFPDGALGFGTFGQALYGRVGRTTGYPADAPFVESARQIQLMLRISF